MEDAIRYLVVDIETESLDPKIVWCVVTKDLQTREVKEWVRPDLKNNGLNEYLSKYTLIAHNGLWFDIPVLNRLCGSKINPQKVIDTLVVSRLHDSWNHNRHGLADWGERLGFPKGDFKNFSEYSEEMLKYCKNDVEVTAKVFEFLREFVEDTKNRAGLRNEHNCAILCKEMNDNGFGFNERKARQLYWEIEQKTTELLKDLQKAFPPRSYLVREITPVATKTGKIHSKDFRFLEGSPEENGYTVGHPFSLIEFEPFKPSSPKQIVERLNEYGWKPFEKTKGHIEAERNRDEEKLEKFRVEGWAISEENLKTLPESAPKEAQSLVKYITLTRRLTTLTEWLNAYRPETQSIHGQINAIGTWTHRASHKNPNTGNIVRVQSKSMKDENGKKTSVTLWGEEGGWGADYRSLWQTRKGWKLVGCDAEGIQLRVLAHYMQDEEFTKALLEGDVHTLNMDKLNTKEYVCKTRDVAKTFIYSWVLGAAAAKTASVLNCTVKQAVTARESFVNSYPGLRYLKEVFIPNDVHNGYFIGFDNRLVLCDSNHLMLAGYLQNGETCIMKRAMWLTKENLMKEKIPHRFVNFVHDEIQFEVLDQDDLPEIAGKIAAEAIVQAGVDLGVRCPQAGKYKVGMNWYETH